MKGFWRRGTKHIDEEKVAAVKRDAANFQRLIELGDEESFVAMTKLVRPDISREDLKDVICQFRKLHQKHLRGAPHQP